MRVAFLIIVAFVVSIKGSFTVNYVFKNHKNCDVSDGTPESIGNQDIIINTGDCDPMTQNMGCVNDSGSGSTFSGCYNTVEEIPLASIVEVTYLGCDDCSCDIDRVKMAASAFCSGTSAPQLRYCTTRSNILTQAFFGSNDCTGSSTDLNSNAGCSKLGSTSSQNLVCVGELGKNPAPPSSSTMQTSGSSRLSLF